MALPPSGAKPPPTPTHPPVTGGFAPDGGRVFLDACVLFPPMVRSLLLSLAAEGGFTALWSPRVLEEWRRAVARQHGADAALEAEQAARRMVAAFPGGEAVPDPALEADIRLPDPADAHVLAAAVAGRADMVLTFNLRDFPERILAGHGLTVQHPDSFLWGHLGQDPARMAGLAAGVLAAFDVAPARRRSALKRAGLPRFGKALAAFGEPASEDST